MLTCSHAHMLTASSHAHMLTCSQHPHIIVKILLPKCGTLSLMACVVMIAILRQSIYGYFPLPVAFRCINCSSWNNYYSYKTDVSYTYQFKSLIKGVYIASI